MKSFIKISNLVLRITLALLFIAAIQFVVGDILKENGFENKPCTIFFIEYLLGTYALVKSWDFFFKY